MAEVWPNSPQLEIDKTADKYEWQAGEQVAYRIVVNNVTAGTIAKDVLLLILVCRRDWFWQVVHRAWKYWEFSNR